MFYYVMDNFRQITLCLVMSIMVLLFDGNSGHVAHAWRKIGLFGENNPNFDYSRTNQMPWTDHRDFSLSPPLFQSCH